MTVKWHGLFSATQNLPGGGPQGCHLGSLEYGAQSNNSGQCVSAKDRYKFVDDMTLLEVINLITFGISSYNVRNHVPSDIGTDQSFIPAENIRSQKYLDSVQQWTDEKKMKLNKEKTKVSWSQWRFFMLAQQ